MSKAFTRESDDGDDDDDVGAPSIPAGAKNYVTPAGYARLRAAGMRWLAVERLREIDRRIRFLSKRLDIAEVVDPSVHHGSDRVFFGATLRYVNARDETRTITIKGVDESDSTAGEVSWIAPIARALLGARVGDEIRVQTPAGVDTIEVLEVNYPAAPAGTD